MPRFLVTGATGTIGRVVVDQLLDAGAYVRALTRDPDRASLPVEAEVMRGDFTRPESLDDALTGVEGVFLVWTAPRPAVNAAIDRIARHARRVVLLTAPLKTPHPLFQQPNPVRELHAHLERSIEAAGLSWTFLRPGMFATNALGWWADQIRTGDSVRWPYASLATAPIHESDVASVAVRALCENGHEGREYVITGPEPLTHAEQVATIGRALGRPLRLEEISREDATRELRRIMPRPAIQMLLDAWGAADGHPAFLTSTVAELTGRPARTFLEWASDHAREFGRTR